MPDPTHDAGAIVNVETRHEESDVNVRALLWFVVIFVIFGAVSHLALWLLFKFFVQIARGEAANAPMTSVARPVDANVPPLPRLQPFPNRDSHGQPVAPFSATPVIDLAEMRAHEDAVLTSYGWVDRQHGLVHIPIEEAKRRALRNNMFALNEAAAPAAASTTSQTTAPDGKSQPAASGAASPPVKVTQPATATTTGNAQ